ncbi:MAG: CDP-alcohol phosphatidyltransferase family protein [bacterium]|nr:CDP-alcohol phosphatidyltransferase family protein [bacterium]
MAINKVFLFIPNLISYARIVFYFVSFLSHTLGYWQVCVVLYIVGCVCDILDGIAARKLNQCTQFGAATDMIEDRVAETGLCLILAQLYPHYTLVFILVIALDISSHYYLVYLKALQGATSHKVQATQSEYRWLRLVYGNAYVLGLLWVGKELVYISLYILYYTGDGRRSWLTWDLGFWQIALLVCLPLYVLKQFTNILQLKSSVSHIAALDAVKHTKQSDKEPYMNFL